MRNLVFLVFVIQILNFSNSYAADNDYSCVVKSALVVTAEGTPDTYWTNKNKVGENFIVDRITGRIIGGPLDNSKLDNKIIDKGTSEMPFQVFSQSKQRTHTTHLQIQEFVNLSEKPFIGTTTLYYPGVYFGLCK